MPFCKLWPTATLLITHGQSWRLCLFGALRIEGTGNARARMAVLAQPKRMALLARLAAAAVHGPIERDMLHGVFWPETRQSNARRALNQAVHFLRSQLGADVILSCGTLLRLNEAVISCDILDVNRFLRSGRYAEALNLYVGDLLEGFHASGMPGLDEWLARARRRWREEAAAAAWKLAEGALTVGEEDQGLHWARRAYDLRVGPDETALRRMLLTYDRVGNRAALMRTYDDFARDLEYSFCARPSPETHRLLLRLLNDSDMATPFAGVRREWPQVSSAT